MDCRAVLEIEECQYQLLRFKYSFSRDTSRNGRPSCPMYGGTFYFQIESTDENKLLKILLRDGMDHYIKGNIRVFQTYDDKTIRNISFEAFMFFVGEYMQTYPSMPMITTFALSPLRLDVNDRVRIDRRWPETYNGLWEKYKPEEKKFVKVESEPDLIITDTYWIDENGQKQKELYLVYPVTLYVTFNNYQDNEYIELMFGDNGSDGYKEASYSGNVNSEGVIVIDNFILKTRK